MSFPVLTQKGHWSIKITNGLLGLRQQRLSESHEIDTLMYKCPQKNTKNTHTHTLKTIFTIFTFHHQIFPKKFHSLTHPFSRLPGDSPGTGRCRQRRHRPRLGTRQSALRSEHLACSVQCKKSLHFCWDYLKNHYFFEKNLKLKKKVIKN